MKPINVSVLSMLLAALFSGCASHPTRYEHKTEKLGTQETASDAISISSGKKTRSLSEAEFKKAYADKP